MVADFWSGLDPTDPTGSAGPGTLQHFLYSRVIFQLLIQFLQEVNKQAVNIENKGHLSSIKADNLILFEVNT